MVYEDAQKMRAFEMEHMLRPGNRRMSTLAAVYSVDRHVTTPEKIIEALFREGAPRQRSDRPIPQFKHVAAFFPKTHDLNGEMLTTTGPLEACCWAAREVTKRRGEWQPLVRLIDGQQSLWDAAALCHDETTDSGGLPETSRQQTSCRTSDHLGETVIEILDILHVSQYVWKAAKAFYAHRNEQETFARERLLRILRGEIRGVVTGMRRMSTMAKLTADARKKIAKVCGDFERHQSRMNYGVYLQAGYPIATGVIESTCKHLAKDRVERSGMRWTLEGDQAMLNVRAVHQSTDWEEFQKHRIQLEQESLHPHQKLLRNYSVPLAG
jgi:hypothetical protein